MVRWIICQTKEAKRSKIAGTADEIVGNFVRINYVYNACKRLCRCRGGGDIFMIGTPGLELWSAHRLSWLRLYAGFTQSLEASVRVELQMTPRPLPMTRFTIQFPLAILHCDAVKSERFFSDSNFRCGTSRIVPK